MSMDDKKIRGNGGERTFITVPMSPEFRARVVKAAGRNELSTARYIRRAVAQHMEEANEWSIPGPAKGSA